jgi:hypothetical protein
LLWLAIKGRERGRGWGRREREISSTKIKSKRACMHACMHACTFMLRILLLLWAFDLNQLCARILPHAKRRECWYVELHLRDP